MHRNAKLGLLKLTALGIALCKTCCRRWQTLAHVVSIIAILVSFDSALAATNFVEQIAFLKASNARAENYFGGSVAAWGDTIIIGAYGESSKAVGVNAPPTNYSSASGAAYVFCRKPTGWVQEAYLKPSTNLEYAQFGTSVSIGENYAVVGTPELVGGAGSAYVFVKGEKGWREETRLRPPVRRNGDHFGWSVAFAGNTVVVGAPSDRSGANSIDGNPHDNSGLGYGAAYVYVRDSQGWRQEAYLKPSNSRAGFSFGSAVAISGDIIVVGAPREDSDPNGNSGGYSKYSHSGAAYVFERKSGKWRQRAYLKIDKTGVGDEFGEAVSISDNTIVIGASKESSDSAGDSDYQINNNHGYSGAAYVFERTNDIWKLQKVLKSSDSKPFQYFGESVSIVKNELVVGSDQPDGCAYLFKKLNGSWHEAARIKATNTIKGERFGNAVTISDKIIGIGAYYQGESDTSENKPFVPGSLKHSGGVYLFSVPSKNY